VQLSAEEVAVPLPSVASTIQFSGFMPNSVILNEIPNNLLGLVEFRLLGYRQDATHDSPGKPIREPLDVRPKHRLEFWSLWIPARRLLNTDIEVDARCRNIPGCVKEPSRAMLYPMNLVPFAIAFYVFPDHGNARSELFIGMHVARAKIIQ
jgi:hypothetical protein